MVMITSINLSGCSSLTTLESKLTISQSETPLSNVLMKPPSSSPTVNQKADTLSNISSAVLKKNNCSRDLWQRVRDGYKLMPTSLPSKVHTYRKEYLQRRDYLKTVFSRSEPFLFFIVEQLEKSNMPLELALLPIVESAFNPFAYSRSHAAGLWQFIPSTGAYFGLEKNNWYDGRRDIVASTAAAIEYLTYLHQLFDNDWLLALAAYNTGQGSLAKKISQSRAKGQNGNFWSLELSQETAQYVPRLLALADLVKNPQHYSIDLPHIPDCAYFEIVTIANPIDIATLQEKTDLSSEAFFNLNPAFNRSITPPDGSYNLLIPIKSSEQLKQFISAGNMASWVSMREHLIVTGDTLSEIALSNKISIGWLKNFNNLSSDQIKVGEVIMIPTIVQSHWNSHGRHKHCYDYRVVRGDTLLKIAHRFNLSLTDLRAMNKLSSDIIKIGHILQIPCYVKNEKKLTKTPIIYRVRLGDSLTQIAREFGVSVTDITHWNNIRRETILRPNQTLKIFVDTAHL
ncbi:MAG: lytic murein transglycosylase [Porticoccaceae bacterium]|nr:lytic murein transglycosylase [Porticoccaceae bacterium]|tara:strand:+ start:1899 stop:3437 length:1539 start_codon:yes stop_codon:yes gene_type:complete